MGHFWEKCFCLFFRFLLLVGICLRCRHRHHHQPPATNAVDDDFDEPTTVSSMHFSSWSAQPHEEHLFVCECEHAKRMNQRKQNSEWKKYGNKIKNLHTIKWLSVNSEKMEFMWNNSDSVSGNSHEDDEALVKQQKRLWWWHFSCFD